MANIKHVNSVVDREFRNRINQLIDAINIQGKTIQDLVVEGQLTTEQYAELITVINGLIKSGHVDKSDLTPEFKDEIEGFSAQLAQTETKKADKIYVDNSLSGKRDKSVPIGLNDASSELLSAIQGGTTVEVLSIPRPDSVTPSTLSVDTSAILEESPIKVEYGVNLFNKDTALQNTLLSEVNIGELITSTGWQTSDLTPVEPRMELSFSAPRRLLEYNKFKQPIIESFRDINPATATTITTTSETHYVRFSSLLSGIDTAQVKVGKATSRRYPYSGKLILNPKLGKEVYADRVVNNRYEIKAGGKNLYDKTTSSANSLLATNGTVTGNSAGWVTSDFIEVPQQPITINQVRYIHEYDKYFEPVVDSYADLGSVVTHTFTPKINTKYIRFTFYATSNLIQAEVGSVATDHTEHYYSLFVDGKKVHDLLSGGTHPVETNIDTSAIDYSKVNLKQFNVLSTFGSDDGWVDSEGTGLMETDTTNVTYGTESIKTTGSASGISKTIVKPTTVNIKDKTIVLKIYVPDPTNIDILQVFFGSVGFTDYYRWTVQPTRLKSGWNTITHPTSDLIKVGNISEENIELLRIYHRAKAGTTSEISFDAIGLTESAINKGKVCIMFDDGELNIWQYAKPTLDKYGFRAVIPAIRNLIGTNGYMTMDQLKILYENGWDITTHGQRDLTTMTREELATEFDYNKEILLENGFNRSAVHYVSHQGKYNELAIEEMKKRFITHRTTEFRYVTLPVADKYRLGNLSGNESSITQLKAYVDYAEKNKVVAMINWHKIVESNPTGNAGLASVFEEFVDYLATSNVDVVTISDIFNPNE